MISKFAIVEEEADEAVYWLEIARQRGLIGPVPSEDLSREAHELTAIMVASRRTLQRSSGKSR
jgi:four helix bundle protein